MSSSILVNLLYLVWILLEYLDVVYYFRIQVWIVIKLPFWIPIWFIDEFMLLCISPFWNLQSNVNFHICFTWSNDQHAKCFNVTSLCFEFKSKKFTPLFKMYAQILNLPLRFLKIWVVTSSPPYWKLHLEVRWFCT